ncbi:MAG: aminotransferase class I/II-fold pyridoxal phosphate-dependent enzyme, partial [Bryobacteraceae bacterium]
MFSARTNWLLEENELAKLCRARKRAGLPILDLTESNPTQCGFDYGPEVLLAAFQNPLISRYEPDPHGLLSARQAVLDYYGEQGIAIDPDQVFLTSSTSEAYSFIFRLICNPADQALAPQPSYPLFDYLARLNDVELARYSLRYEQRWQIDCESLALQIASHSRAILAVHPNNPTGSFVTPTEREFLLQLANKHGLALIADEVFFDYRYGAGSSQSSGQPLLSLGGAPKHENSRTQVAAAAEGGDPSADGEPGEGLEPNLSARARSQAKDQARLTGSVPGRAPLSFAGERG